MAVVVLDNVTVEFPILHMSHRSLKKAVLARTTGGAIMRDAGRPTVVRALHDVSLNLKSGDRVGIVGPNGAGKTTLLRAMAGIYEPCHGYVHTEGNILTILDLGLGLNRDMTGRENIGLRGTFLGLSRAEARELEPEIEVFTELGAFLDMPIRTYSSGMLLRLSFGIATSMRPDILLMDEWVLAGDAGFVEKARSRMANFVTSAQIILIASHSNQVIRQWCTKAIYLDGGEVQAAGEVEPVLDAYAEAQKVRLT
jgi:ABC-type polysaccharide/polyol phosphate transport system ATPase subunit